MYHDVRERECNFSKSGLNWGAVSMSRSRSRRRSSNSTKLLWDCTYTDINHVNTFATRSCANCNQWREKYRHAREQAPVKWCCMLAIAGNLHGKFPRGPTAPIHNETQISYMWSNDPTLSLAERYITPILQLEQLNFTQEPYKGHTNHLHKKGAPKPQTSERLRRVAKTTIHSRKPTVRMCANKNSASKRPCSSFMPSCNPQERTSLKNVKKGQSESLTQPITAITQDFKVKMSPSGMQRQK